MDMSNAWLRLFVSVFRGSVCSLYQAGSFHSIKLSLTTLTVHLHAVHVLMELLHIPGLFSILCFWLVVLPSAFWLSFPKDKFRSWSGPFGSTATGLSRWTAIILIAADKCSISHFLLFSSTCLSILMTWASRLSLAWLNWWSKGPTEQNNLQTFFSWKAKQEEGEEKRRAKILRSQIRDMC